MFGVNKLSSLHQDYLVSFLRSQLTTLQNVLSSVENHERYDDSYLEESMKHIEQNMRRFRKTCSN